MQGSKLSDYLVLFILTTMMISCRSYRTFSEKQFGRPLSAQEQILYEESRKCGKVYALTPAERSKKYPFSKASTIQLVSFKNNSTDELNYDRDSLPRMNDTVCYSKLFEIITLRSSQIDILTDLLYNYGRKSTYTPPKGVFLTGSIPTCYNPRNAILFIDQNNQVYDFIEICFECDNWETSSTIIDLGESCTDKLKLLKQFFLEVGVHYGTTELSNK